MQDLLAWKGLESLIKFLRIDFMDLFYCLKDLKMLYLDLWYLGNLIQNLLDKEWVWRLWEPCEYIGYLKGFCENTWNWTVFWFHVNCELFMFYLWAMTCDYPTRYYSQCDIGILALIFVMVISLSFVSANEFWLCVGKLVLALCWQMSSGSVSAMNSSFVSTIVMWP